MFRFSCILKSLREQRNPKPSVKTLAPAFLHRCSSSSSSPSPSPSASSPSLSIWRRKKEMGKEGLFVVHEIKRLAGSPPKLERFMKSHVSRLLRTDLLAVLAEFQRQDNVFLSLKMNQMTLTQVPGCADLASRDLLNYLEPLYR